MTGGRFFYFHPRSPHGTQETLSPAGHRPGHRRLPVGHRPVDRLHPPRTGGRGAGCPGPQIDDVRRRYYRLTALGQQVVRLEAEHLAQMVNLARQRGLLSSFGDAP